MLIFCTQISKCPVGIGSGVAVGGTGGSVAGACVAGSVAGLPHAAKRILVKTRMASIFDSNFEDIIFSSCGGYQILTVIIGERHVFT
jgi:hypothetical protein